MHFCRPLKASLVSQALKRRPRKVSSKFQEPFISTTSRCPCVRAPTTSRGQFPAKNHVVLCNHAVSAGLTLVLRTGKAGQMRGVRKIEWWWSVMILAKTQRATQSDRQTTLPKRRLLSGTSHHTSLWSQLWQTTIFTSSSHLAIQRAKKARKLLCS